MSEVIYNFDSTQWSNLKTSIKSQSHPDRSVSFCADYGFCNQKYGYNTYGYGKYSDHNQTSNYTNHSNSHNQYFPGYFAHANTQVTGHYNYTGYADCNQTPCSKSTTRPGYHGNCSQSGHTNAYGHGNVCSNACSNYSKTTSSCYDVSSHSNSLSYCYECSQVNAYNNAIGLTTNMPNAPILLGTENGDIPRLAKTVTLGLFAYDKDYNLGVTQVEKEVYFDLYIQKIQDDSGNVLTGQPLTKILANQKESAIGEGFTFNFDTTAYSDGYYRLIGVSRNAPGSYYMQDIPTDSITVSGNYNGADLYSGLLFNAGERPDKPMYTNLKAGTTYNMVTVNKVRIKQNSKSFFEIKNAATTMLNFIFANDDALELEEGRYSKDTSIKQVYSQSGIADGDDYVLLRGWTEGLTARLEVEEPDVAQYIKVMGSLYRKSDGTLIPGSSVTAQFPIDKSSASAYVELMQGGGSGIKREAYLYWPATLFSAANLVNGIEDIEVRTTIYEYENSSGTTLADTPQTSSSIKTNEDGSESATRAVFQVDKFSPDIKTNAVRNTWLKTAVVTITVDDRYINNAVNASGESSGVDKILVTVRDRDTDSIIDIYDWSTANSEIPANTTVLSRDITITAPSFYNNVGIDITAWDKVGNKATHSVNDIKIDNTEAVITVNPIADSDWHNTKINTITTVSKPNGAPCASIKIAETNSPTRPADDDSAWQNVAISGGGAIYPNQTTGQMSGQHYVHVWVEKGAYDPLNPTSTRIDQTFGPYKVDLVLPEMLDFEPSDSYVQKNGWYWEIPTFDLNVVDNGGSQMKDLRYIISSSPMPPEVDDSWTSLSPETTSFPVSFPAGEKYVHVYMQDNALNEQIRTCPLPIKVDTSNPVIDITRTIMSDAGTANASGKIIGYANFEISASDAVSGVKVAKYAITDSPVAPDFSVIGNTNAANLGRTNGWIDFSAYSDIGVSIDVKAPGKSYVYVYVEDNAGRMYNSTVSTVTAPTTDGIYMFPEITDVVPTYLYELDVDTSGDNPVAERDSETMSSGVKNIFAIKNLSNITNFNLHYVNYQSDLQQSLKVEIIDCKTNEVVRTSRTLVNYAVGDTEIDDIAPYSFPVWWVNGTTGQKLPSGVYEIRASMLDGNEVVNSISSYAIIKQNILTQPVIDYRNLGSEASITSTFTEDTFYDDLKANGYANSFINSFIDDLAANRKTKYSTSLVDRDGAKENAVHNPIFDADNKYAYTTVTTKFVTVVALVEDIFANVARTSQVVDFFDDGTADLTPEEQGVRKERADKVNNAATPVKLIETPSAENYIINGSKQEKDEMEENPFDFIE